MSDKNILNLAVIAGQIMLENGAETYRVEDTMTRILEHFYPKISESFVTTTGLFVSIGSDTVVKRIRIRTIHLKKIALVNDLSRKIVSDEISTQEAFNKLREINLLKPYPVYVKTIMSGITCFCFSYLFGGTLMDCVNSLMIGIILNLITWILISKNVSNFLVTIIGGIIISFFAIVFLNLGIGNNIDKIIIGSIMPLVPGVGLTNSIRDILEGDFLSGSGRIFDAMIIGVAVATGVGTVLKVWIQLFGGFIL